MTFATIHSPVLSLNVRASLDTHQRIPYTPHRTTPKNPKLTVTPSAPTITTTHSPTLSVQELLSRPIQDSKQVQVSEATFMGYDAWLPTPPKVDKPRSVYNAASLAFIGDCIYELYARRHFLFPPLNIEEYNDQVMAVVRCEAQDAMLQKLINDKVLSKEERDIIRWGKNVSSAAKTRTKKRAGVAVYNRASSLETLVGHLYLTNTKLNCVRLTY
ncbi:RNase III domain-containing protein [Heracleum sosnowskyi]|uniref:RNase III domain-containing protein n=1 Tax=Heracleum sosnowskyi TaxID=360622 RepID=A0AAD8H0V8_9APIA|nr:RNase III domain-containing protein [Heracleum sosnowskyi]